MILIGLSQQGRVISLTGSSYAVGGAPTPREIAELDNRSGDEFPGLCTFPTTEDEEECGYNQNGLYGTLCQIHGERVAADVAARTGKSVRRAVI
jgi:hypothetical protein